ncbi:MAG: tetratricopeptide repeat protein [Deltaproteobacteria bacterium]|nr:tetratricopeptide repeat protein [Deltaproteobacteria bacterium]
MPSDDLLAGLAALLQERVGLQVRPEGQGALRLAVMARFEDPRPPPVSLAGYLAHLRSAEGDEELRRLLPLVTVGKTHFFRDQRQFQALAELLPGLLAARRAEGRPLSIWSAGCATGEEPYTIAMVAAEAGAEAGDLELLATDVNPEAAAFAMAGRFPEKRTRDVPAPLRERYFEAAAEGLVVGSRLRSLLSGVRVHNLVSQPSPRPLSGSWDLIFCRNVIIYFDTPTAQAVLGRFLASLAPGGWLFLGYSESLFRMFEGFELCEVGGAFLYRRPEGVPPAAPPPREPRTPRALGQVPRYAPQAVRHAAPPPAPPAAPPARPRPAFSAQEILDAAVQLCAAGRFAEARARLEAHLAQGGEELAVRLTLANLLGVLQEPDAAGAGYQAALRQEPLSAEAHLLHGVHLFGRGEPDRAAEELSRALFLDPELAMAHYYLGRCREAQADPLRARLCYRNAVDAHRRQPAGRSHPFVGHYPDLPEDGAPFARAAEYALVALGERAPV